MGDSEGGAGRVTRLPWQKATWLHEPRSWEITEDQRLVVAADPHTDFWRLTHSGIIQHNGHFYGQPVEEDFTLTACVTGAWRWQYDQAGLMVHGDETHWMKAGVEFYDALPRASVVVTRDTSDWSLVTAPNPEQLWFQVRRHGTTLEVSISGDGRRYALFRQCSFVDGPVRAGPFCCSPGDGFTATFSGLELAVPPQDVV